MVETIPPLNIFNFLPFFFFFPFFSFVFCFCFFGGVVLCLPFVLFCFVLFCFALFFFVVVVAIGN